MRLLSATALILAALSPAGCGPHDLDQTGGVAHAIAARNTPVPPASQSADPDLELDRSCRGHPSAKKLQERLTIYIKELVVMWPRAGRMKDESGCRTVARITALNHQGVPITVSFIIHDSELRPQGQDYRLLNEATPPRAVMDMVASSEYPHVLVEAAGAASTSRDALEGLLEFLHPEQVVSALLPPP